MLDPDIFRKRFFAALLGPQITDEDLIHFTHACREHAQYIAGIVVNPCQVRAAVAELATSGLQVICPIAYPLGNLPGEIKKVQFAEALQAGASGVAMLMQLEAVRSDDFEEASKDVREVLAIAPQGTTPVGLIANTPYLTDDQAVAAAHIASDVGAAFITATGFGVESEPQRIQMIREALGAELKIVAAGGCRSAEQAGAYLRAGANAIASSHAIDIIQESR